MSDIFIKTGNAGSTGWRKAANIFIKTASAGSTGWKAATNIFLKTATQWLRVWPLSGVYATRSAWIGPDSTTAYADRLTSSSYIRIGSNYYGNNAQWDANGWTISSYSYAWKYYDSNTGSQTGTTFSGESGTGSGWTSSGTGQDVLPLATWDNATNNTTYDRKYLRFEVTANATNSTYSGFSPSPYIQIVRRIPQYTGNATLSGTTPTVDTEITYTSPTWDTTEARKAESSRTTIKWYRNSTNTTTGGTIVQDSTSSTPPADPKKYTPKAADIGSYLYVVEERFNSGTDVDLGSTTGVKATVVSAATVTDVNYQATGQQRRIALPSNFTSNTTLYISTNGYINWGGNDPGGSISIPTSGITLAPLNADLIQGIPAGNGTNASTGGLWTYSDSTNFYVRWEGNYYNDFAQLADYQVKFYWDQAYADVYFINNALTSATPSTTAVQNGLNVSKTWSQSTAQTSTLLSTSSMTKNTTNDGVDDNRTAIVASKPSAPTIDSITFTGTNTVNVSFSGGSGPYYQLYWNTNNVAPSNTSTYYDAAGTSSPMTETISPTEEQTYYFWIRSSTQNITATTQSGLATAGTFSDWSSVFSQKLFATPTALSATTNDSAKIRLTWSGGGVGPNYQMYYAFGTATRPTDDATFFDFSAGATSPYDWTGMSRGTNYYFYVRANIGTTAYTNWYPATAPGILGRAPLYKPGTPTSPSASVQSSTRIDFSWTAPTTTTTQDAASSYDIYYSTNSTAPTSTTSATTTSTSTSIQATSLTADTTYYFWVRSTNADNTGTNASAWTSSVSAKTQKTLTTPTSLSATSNDSTKIRLTWSGGAGDGYVIDYTTSDTGTPSGNTFDLAASSSPYDWTGMTRGTTYYFFIKARNGTSPNYTYAADWYPQSAPGTSGKAPLYKPGTPTSPSATKQSSSQIDFSWTAPTTSTTQDAASSYDIYYSTSSTAPTSTTSATTTSTTTSISATSLTASTTYYFWVRATNADNTGSNASAWTSSVSATTDAATSAPSGGSVSVALNSGTAGRVGAVYRATLTNASGTPTPTGSYQWQWLNVGPNFDVWTNISGATSQDYTIPYDYVSRKIRCRATFSNGVSPNQVADSNEIQISNPTITGISVTFSTVSPFAVWRFTGYNFQAVSTRAIIDGVTQASITVSGSTNNNPVTGITRNVINGGNNSTHAIRVRPESTSGGGGAFGQGLITSTYTNNTANRTTPPTVTWSNDPNTL